MGRAREQDEVEKPAGIRAGLIAFASELNRFRSLTLEESRLVEKAQRGIEHRPITRPWTFADDAKLQRLRRTRLRVPEIAAELGRTPAAVYSRIRDLKARRKNG